MANNFLETFDKKIFFIKDSEKFPSKKINCLYPHVFLNNGDKVIVHGSKYDKSGKGEIEYMVGKTNSYDEQLYGVKFDNGKSGEYLLSQIHVVDKKTQFNIRFMKTSYFEFNILSVKKGLKIIITEGGNIVLDRF